MPMTIYDPLRLPLLILLAMGNWVNTNSPPLDPDAPAASGNSGRLLLDIDGESLAYSIQSATLSGDTISLQGEAVGGKTQFSLSARLPGRVIREGVLKVAALRGATLTVVSGSLLADGRQQHLTGGTLKLTSATGHGPWELDGEAQLEGESLYQGRLEVRVTAA